MTARLYHEIEDTVYFWFAANDTSGSGGDGATPVADVRLAGAAASAIPTLSPTPVLLTHANFPPGCHELAVAATAANGFAADSTYAVFTTLLIDSQNPSGFLGSFTLSPVLSNPWDEPMVDHVAFDSFGRAMQGLVPIMGRVDVGPSEQNFDTDGFVEASTGHFNGSVVVFTTGALKGQHRIITQYTAANQNMTFDNNWSESPANNDEFVILGQSSGSMSRQINVSSLGAAQVDVVRVNGSNINSLVSGRVDSSVGAMAAGTVTAAAVATGAIDADAIATGAIDADAIAANAIGNSELATGAIGSGTFATGAITSTAIATDAIGNVEIANGAISSGKFAAGAIDSTAIATDAIGAAQIAANAIGASEIADGAIDAATFAAGAIDAAAIATDAINVTKIAPNAISSDELATSAARKIRGVGPTGVTDSGTASTIVDATAGGFGDSTTDDVWNGMAMYLISGALAGTARLITDYDQASDTITVTPDFPLAVGAGVTYEILPWSSVNLELWEEAVPNALVAGAVDADISAIQAGAIDAAAIGTGAIDADAIAANAIGASEIAANAIGSSELANNAITSDKIAAGAINVSEFTAFTVDDIADGVWDELAAGHTSAGKAGEQLWTDIDAIITAVVGTIAEITGAGDIPTTPTIKQAIMLRYQMDRNAGQATATERRVMNNAGTEVLDATMSDDATTFDQGLLGAP